MTRYRIELRVPDQPAREVSVEAPLVVGRECEGVVLADPKTSRRHLKLSPGPDGLTVVDLGSTNGTWLNGVVVRSEATLAPGDIVRVGDTEIVVLAGSTQVVPVLPPPGVTSPEPVREPSRGPSGPAGPTPPAARPVLDELMARETDAAIIRYRPGTAGADAAAGMAAAVRRARRRLAGLGSEPWGTKPQVCLVDPFPDPDRPGHLVTGGTVVDAARNEIWMAVTSEAPAEPPERPLALLFGAALPAAADLGTLLEGYGLHLAGGADPDPHLRDADLPSFGAAEGELASAMALSFVRHLLVRGGESGFRRLLAETKPGRLDAAAQDVYGLGLAALEEAWRRKVGEGQPPIRTGQFLRLTLRYLRPHVRRELEMSLYMLGGLAFTVVFPFAFRRLLDDAIPSGRLSEVVTILVLLGVAFIVSLLADLRRSYLSAYVSGSVVRDLRAGMFGRLQSLGAGWFHRRQEGDVISRLFSDVAVLEGGLSQTVRDGLFQMLSLVVSAIVLFTLNPLLAAIVLAGAPLVALVYKAMGKGAQRRSVAVQEQTGGLLGVASENYGAQPVVKAFGLEARERARFGRAADRLFTAQVRLQLFGGLFGLSVSLIVTILRLVVLGLGAWLILEGRLTVGGLVAFMGVMGEVLGPVTMLTNIGEQIQASTGALTRINDVLEAVPDVADAPDATPLPPLSDRIRLKGVGFSYTTERRTLEDIDVEITAGSKVAFVGPTGAGKSSVLQLLMRSYDPDEGSVRFDGRDLRTATVASVRGQMGVVFQDTFLFDTTIGDNIATGLPGATDTEIEAAARAAELHEFVAGLPRGYDTPVGERGTRLSGGQRQRVAIARALIRQPRTLLLDEATSALDPRTERLIAATLDRVSEGRTTIAVTHRLASITTFDCIFVIVAGRVAEQGTHPELLGRGGVYADLWSEQSGGVVAQEVPFDAVAALGRVALFAGLGAEDLSRVARRLRAVDLAPGESVAEGEGRLVLVRHGRAKVVAPGLAGSPVTVAELGPGDGFGVSALLGQESGARLCAVERVGLLVLDDEAVVALAAAFPSVAAVVQGAGPPTARPIGGRRLSRSSLSPGGPGPVLAPITAPAGPTTDEVRRTSGSFPGLLR